MLQTLRHPQQLSTTQLFKLAGVPKVELAGGVKEKYTN
jgi:hypothetical protein